MGGGGGGFSGCLCCPCIPPPPPQPSLRSCRRKPTDPACAAAKPPSPPPPPPKPRCGAYPPNQRASCCKSAPPGALECECVDEAEWGAALRSGKPAKRCFMAAVLKRCSAPSPAAAIKAGKDAKCSCTAKGVFGGHCGKGYVTCAKKGAIAKAHKCGTGECEGG